MKKQSAMKDIRKHLILVCSVIFSVSFCAVLVTLIPQIFRVWNVERIVNKAVFANDTTAINRKSAWSNQRKVDVHPRMITIYDEHRIGNENRKILNGHVVRSYPVTDSVLRETLNGFSVQLKFKRVLEVKGEKMNKAILHFSTVQDLPEGSTIEIAYNGSIITNTGITNNPTLDLEVTDVVNQWVRYPGSKQELKVSVKTGSMRLPGRTVPNYSESEAIHQPLLLVFSTEIKRNNNFMTKRTKRQLDWETYEEESNKITDTSYDPFSHQILSRGRHHPQDKKRNGKGSKGHCKRRPMYVDFKAINYDSWIIAPRGYEAYECVGKCSFPIADHLSPTKHAVLQALVHGIQPDKVTRPCCVPTKLEPISILYVDESDTVTFKYSYDDMVIVSCGCR